MIGIETHAQLSTRSKIFSGASTAFGAAPNTQASAVDLALPGTLPVANRGAVERAIRFGLAVGATVAPLSIFARKNYFYPDLPKGYQISQYETPVVQGGTVEFFVGEAAHRVSLTRAHLEEDAGKSIHGIARSEDEAGGAAPRDYAGDWTGIDLNRAGTPLLEIVTEPDMRSSVEAVEYAKALHALVVWLDICDGNMQEGSFRCDANVSVRRPGAPFGTRREIKNLNSFRFMQQAIDYEVQWQIDLLEDGGQVQQATVLFDPEHGETRAMRSKEDAHDYRYFPDPDLPPLAISEAWIAEVRATMPELPREMAARFQRDYALAEYDARIVTQSKEFAAYFESAARASGQPKLVANWMMGEISRRMNAAALTLDSPAGGPARRAGRADRRQHHLQQRRAPGLRRALARRRRRRRRDHRGAGPAPDARRRRARAGGRGGDRRQSEVGRGIPRRQGEGVQRPGRPGDEGDPGQGRSGAAERAAASQARRLKREAEPAASGVARRRSLFRRRCRPAGDGGRRGARRRADACPASPRPRASSAAPARRRTGR